MKHRAQRRSLKARRGDSSSFSLKSWALGRLESKGVCVAGVTLVHREFFASAFFWVIEYSSGTVIETRLGHCGYAPSSFIVVQPLQ